jgi:F0F1-type ATP synthase membrane subunit b/b'
MTTDRQYADQLADVLMQIEDLKVKAASICAAAKEDGRNVAKIKKGARELCMDSTKLAKKIEAEEQLDMFRQELDLLRRKGLAQFRGPAFNSKLVAAE